MCLRLSASPASEYPIDGSPCEIDGTKKSAVVSNEENDEAAC